MHAPRRARAGADAPGAAPGSAGAAAPGRIAAAAILVLGAGLLGAPAPGAAQDYAALWATGRPYEAFRADITARESLWRRNADRAAVPETLADRAAAAGPWRLLVVAFDRCSDSVSTVPYIAALVDRVDGLEMRIVPPETGRPVMEAHLTPDGRAATPTVVLLDDAGRPRGAWVERPSELQAWYIANPDGLSHDARYFAKMRWYDEDAGASTLAEIVALMESARGD